MQISPGRLTRLKRYDLDWQAAIGKIDASKFSAAAKADLATLSSSITTNLMQIESDALRQNSRRQLEETRQRYDAMLASLKRAEQSMDPVLRKLHDYVLSLKHTLNAAAIASLSGESARIQSDVARLISDMDAAIARADEFIRQMPQ